MSSKWFIIYYTNKDGKCLIEDFINSRKVRNKAKILSFLAILEEKGPTLPRPYADILEDGIHELRIKLSGNQYRILYFFCYKEYIVLTHSFLKTTDKVPISEINFAKECRESFLARITEKELKEAKNENI